MKDDMYKHKNEIDQMANDTLTFNKNIQILNKVLSKNENVNKN